MKRITKLASVVALTVVLAASLMACGGKDPVAEDDSKTASDKSTAATETSGTDTLLSCNYRNFSRQTDIINNFCI